MGRMRQNRGGQTGTGAAEQSAGTSERESTMHPLRAEAMFKAVELLPKVVQPAGLRYLMSVLYVETITGALIVDGEACYVMARACKGFVYDQAPWLLIDRIERVLADRLQMHRTAANDFLIAWEAAHGRSEGLRDAHRIYDDEWLALNQKLIRALKEAAKSPAFDIKGGEYLRLMNDYRRAFQALSRQFLDARDTTIPDNPFFSAMRALYGVDPD